MIRPLSLISILLALGSGLYLYQSKHDAQMLDRQIERTVKDTETVREQTRVLHAEWTLLNDPERLRQFANEYLVLKAVAPTQFTSMADLDGRLPAVQIPEPEHPPAIAAGTDGGADAAPQLAIVAPAPAEPLPDVEEEDLPLPPRPVPLPATGHPVVASTTGHTGVASATGHAVAADSTGRFASPLPKGQVAAQSAIASIERKPEPDRRPGSPKPVADASAPRPIQLAEPRVPAPSHSSEQRMAEMRPTMTTSRPAMPNVATQLPVQTAPLQAEALVRPALAQHPVPLSQPPVQAQPLVQARAPNPVPLGGSLLGAAHGPIPAPLPRPMPVNATFGN